MQGSINVEQGLQFADLLYMLAGDLLSGRLEVTGDGEKSGCIEFNEGRISYLSYSGLEDRAALSRLLKEPLLQFQFRTGEASSTAEQGRSVQELLREAAQGPDPKASEAASMAPTPFTIVNRVVLPANNPEETEGILAEFDFLLHYSKKMGAVLGCRTVNKMVLQEDQTLIGFEILGKDEIHGYESPKPYPVDELFDLF